MWLPAVIAAAAYQVPGRQGTRAVLTPPFLWSCGAEMGAPHKLPAHVRKGNIILLIHRWSQAVWHLIPPKKTMNQIPGGCIFLCGEGRLRISQLVSEQPCQQTVITDVRALLRPAAPQRDPSRRRGIWHPRWSANAL